MDSKITSTGKRPLSGFTILEMMVSIGLAGLVFTAVGHFMIFSNRSILAIGNYADMDMAARRAIDQMTRDLRQVSSVKKFDPDKITVVDPNGDDIEYKFDSSKKTFTRGKGNNADVLLKDVEELTFSLFKASPVEEAIELEPADLATARAINVRWKCVRSSALSKSTEVFISTVVVFRPQ